MDEYVISGAAGPDGVARDWFVDGGVLVGEAPARAEVIDAAGLLVLPGLVDPHTHLREPGGFAETIETGTRAAARGGYTCVMAMPNTDPATNGPDQVVWLRRRALEVGARAQVVPIGAVTVDRAGGELADLLAMAGHGVRVFSDDGAAVATEELLRAALLAVKPFSGVVAEHAQDPALAGPGAWRAVTGARPEDPADWPTGAEVAIVERDARLALETGSRVHICHVSTAEALDVIRWAKARGAAITAEATPHHLLLTSDLLAGGDPVYKVNPPLRGPEDVAALRQAVADGTVDMIGTDHAPHRPSDKAKPLPEASPGMVGLETALGVVIEALVRPGFVGWEDVARLMCLAPARLARLVGQGGPLAVGWPANLVLVDPERRRTVDREDTESVARNNPYHGLDLPDPVELTMWRGRVTYRRA
jgi:dihydroorotase